MEQVHDYCPVSAKNNVEFDDGTAVQHVRGDTSYQAWKCCNNMMVSLLVHSVSPSIRQHIQIEWRRYGMI